MIGTQSYLKSFMGVYSIMKNMRSLVLQSLFCVFLLSLAVSSCNKDSSSRSKKSKSSGNQEEIEYEEYSFIDPGSFFELDYTPERPEPKTNAGTIVDASPSGQKGKDSSVIPGVRDLLKYKTRYGTQRITASEIIEATKLNQSAAQKSVLEEAHSLPPAGSGNKTKTSGKADFTTPSAEIDFPEEKGPLVIKDWGPQNQIPGEIATPQFYVEFSLPVKALAALDSPSSESSIMTITPPLAGVFRWYGTRNLSFEATEAANPTQIYTITISDSVTSLGEKLLREQKCFRPLERRVKLPLLGLAKKKANQDHILTMKWVL